MLFSTCSSNKNKATRHLDDNELTSSAPKREKMQVSTPATGAPCIKIEQLVKHDVWDIRRKDDGAFVMKKLNENDTGTTAANTSTANVNTGNIQTGARPKITIEVPKTNNTVTINAANRLQNVNYNMGSTVTSNSVNIPRMEVMPEKNVITLTPMSTQRESVIIINNTPAPNTGLISMKTPAPGNQAVMLSASTTPRKDIITANIAPPPKTEVITINAIPSPKREVITINTKPLIKPAVFTINTGTKKDAVPSTSKDQVHDVWNFPKQENKFAVADISNKDSGPSVSSGKSDGSVQSSSTASYSDEVYRIKEMFPQVPLNVISDNLRINGSVESTIDSLLAQTFVDPVPSSEVPPVAPSSDDDVVFIKSVKSDKPKTDISGGKKDGSLIKIELLTRNEVWDIKKKDKEGFVLKKVGDDVEEVRTEPEDRVSQCNKLASDVSYTDDCVEVMEEDHDPLLDDTIMDVMAYGNPEQSNVPVKLMVYSQSSEKSSQSSNGKVKIPSEGSLDSAMEVDSFNNSCLTPLEKVSVEAFEFSDDENENGETIEYFLFKASLALAKLKCRRESEVQTTENSALLNITGSMKNEEADVAKEVCPDDGDEEDDEYYTDECCTDECCTDED